MTGLVAFETFAYEDPEAGDDQRTTTTAIWEWIEQARRQVSSSN
jgi:hypothetical protein